MKKLFLSLLLCLCFVLCACGDSTAAESDSTQSGAAGDSGTQSENTNGFVPSENAVKALEMKTAESFLGQSALQAFYSELNCTVDIADKVITDSNRVQYSMVFTNNSSGQSHKIENLTAYLAYNEADLEHSLANMFIYGAMAGVCDDEIIVGEIGKLHVYNANNFKERESGLVQPFDDDEHAVFHDIIKYTDGYLVSFTAGPVDTAYATVYNGKDAQKGFLWLKESSAAYIFPMNLKENDEYSLSGKDLKLRGEYKNHIFVGDWYAYDTESLAYYAVTKYAETTNEGGTFIFERWRSLSATDEDKYLVTNIVNGKVKEVDTFRLDGINEIFGINEETNSIEGDLEVQFAHENRDMVITCPYTETTVILDRGSDTGQVLHQPTARQLNEHIKPIRSNDQRYSIYHGASTGGGDYSVSQMILHDSDTRSKYNMYHYIGVIGGMYGGGESIGFFSNNDIYMFGHTDFVVFEEGMPTDKPKFVMSENFPLGEVNEGNIETRYIYAVRRDPKTFEYIVVYADFPYCDHVEQLKIEPDSGYLQPKYTIGFLDSEGRLKDIIKTDAHVEWSYFGFLDVNMYLDGNELHFMPTFKAQYYTTEVVANIDTQEVTVTKYSETQSHF